MRNKVLPAPPPLQNALKPLLEAAMPARRDVRSERMKVMLTAILTLGLVDLALTWATMSSGGLYENNFIVRLLLRVMPSAAILFGYKLAFTAFGLGILWRLRQSAVAQWGAALCLVVFVAVCVQWVFYIGVINSALPGMAGSGDSKSLVALH